jgi:hypothetical protein
MKPLPLVGGAYESQSVPADAQRCINLYLEQDKEGGVPAALYGIPGMHAEFTLPKGPCRGVSFMNGQTFMVSGDTLYEVTGGSPVALGQIQTSLGPVSMANNDNQLMIVDGVAGYIYGAPTLGVIADPDFPNGVTQVAWEGQFFIVGTDGSKQFFISKLGDGSTWDGLDFASAENKPEIIVSFIVHHDRLLIFTEDGAEQWVNTGGALFAFSRDNGSSIEVGCEARDSVVTMNNGVYWLGRDRDGGGMVYALQGGVPQRISTHAIESVLQHASVRSDAYAIAYQQGGHSFYCLTVPSLERTFVYDAATQKWAERAEWISASGSYRRWHPRFHLYDGRKHIVTDWQSGAVWSLDQSIPTQRWLRQTAPLKTNLERQSFWMVELDMEVGVSEIGIEGHVMMRFSDDGGKKWSNERSVSIGVLGDTNARVRFPRCGSGRNRVFEFSGTDTYRPALYGAYADVTAVP